MSLRETVRSLDIAARSILESQAIAGTIAGVIAERALDHHWEGLYQYAAIRVGPEEASNLLDRLANEVEGSLADALDVAPGPQANLYGRLRLLIAGVPKRVSTVDDPIWWTPPDGAYRRGLAELRRTLTPEQAEVAELRFARRLSCIEVAHVLGEPPTQVEHVSAVCVGLSERLLGKRPGSRDHTPEGALLEAFALDTRKLRVPRRQRRQPVLQMGTRIGDRYEVEGLLGAGAFADVYRARDRDVTDHVVALKILRAPAADAESVHNALRELQLIASVFHPSVVQLKDHGWHNGHLWFVMPLYRGETLSMRLQRGALTRREARNIFEPLAEALATMHRVGVLHQDIKPDNVFLANLDPDGGAGTPRRILPVLLDLGVAAKDAELVLAGTPAYFAPEVAARFAGAPDPAPVGPKADVFSLALTLRHALDPDAADEFAGVAVDAFVELRATRAPRPPLRRDLRDLRGFFERCMHFSPDGRPTAEEFHRRLRVLTEPEERRARRIATMRWAVPTTIALLALFASIVYVLSREARIQRLEATEARARAEQLRARAATVSADLTVQQARRRELEADVARLESEYQNNRMTREQLASRLAESEAQLEVVNEQKTQQAVKIRQQSDELRDLRDEHARVQTELAATTNRRDELASKLDRVTEQLSGERAKREEADNTAGHLRDELRTSQAELDDTRKRANELETRVAVLRRLLGSNAPDSPLLDPSTHPASDAPPPSAAEH
ncbi:MAG TPA: protein kinase [Polyangiales bacterium]|nr:protein kinase [Polyangiales bacterium]